MLVGAELLAKYAVKEGTIISSVFTDNIRLSSNNPFKPPYPMNLQIIYKLAGFEFGKIWLIKNVFFFIVFLYSVLKEKLHPVLVGIFVLLFIAIPEMKYNRRQAIIKCFYYFSIPFLFYAIWFFVFMKFYMPVSFDIASGVNPNIFDIDNACKLFIELNKTLIFEKPAHVYYSYFIDLFLISTIANLIIFRNTKGWQLLVWILILYFGYATMVHILPLVVIDMTVKRGFFKLFPIMLIYFSYNKIFTRISEVIHKWEYK